MNDKTQDPSDDSEAKSAELERWLWDEYQRLIYRAELSALYHQKRERFFEICDKGGKAISLIGGSAALWKIGSQKVVAIAAFGIAITSALSLVFSFSERSKKHAELAKSYKVLLADMAAVGERKFTEDELNKWNSRLLSTEATEPTALTALVIICENQIKMSRNDTESLVGLSFWHRFTAHLLDHNRDTIDPPPPKPSKELNIQQN